MAPPLTARIPQTPWAHLPREPHIAKREATFCVSPTPPQAVPVDLSFESQKKKWSCEFLAAQTVSHMALLERVSTEQRISTCLKGRSCDYKDKDGLRVPSAPQVLGVGGGHLLNSLAVVHHQLTRNYRPAPGTRLPGFVQGNQPTSPVNVAIKTLATFWPKHYPKARTHTHVFKVSIHMCNCVLKLLVLLYPLSSCVTRD